MAKGVSAAVGLGWRCEELLLLGMPVASGRWWVVPDPPVASPEWVLCLPGGEKQLLRAGTELAVHVGWLRAGPLVRMSDMRGAVGGSSPISFLVVAGLLPACTPGAFPG